MSIRIGGHSVVVAALAVMLSCGPAAEEKVQAGESKPAQVRKTATIRTTGTVQALESYSVRVPQISGQSSRVTLTDLIPNGSKVGANEVIAEFDRTAIRDEVIATEAKLAETSQQVAEKQAQIRSDRAKRESAMAEARADLQKARLQLRKGPVLSEIDRLKNEAKAKTATERLSSLEKSGKFRSEAEEAALKVLQLKRERQQVTLERLKSNLEKLSIRSPHAGMVALENIWRSGSMGPPQEGDQLWPGQPVLRLFNPQKMIVDASVNESDAAGMKPGVKAKLYLDAYPGAEFEAELVTASPIAVAGLDSPVRSFSVRFKVLSEDRRLLPDLSAAIEIARQQ